MQNNNEQLTAALIKADIANEQGEYQSAYVTLKLAVMETLGISYSELNSMVLDEDGNNLLS